MADASRIRGVAELLAARDDGLQVTVVSAMSGVTDALINLVNTASRSAVDAETALDALAERHRATADVLLEIAAADALVNLERDWDDLHALLRAISLLGHPANDLLDYVQGLG
jgi:aspartokinase/homoserine dehydrogenase 1